MNIEYKDKKVTTHYFKDVGLSEIFMVNGHLFFRCDVVSDKTSVGGHWNSVNLETGHHCYFSPYDNIQLVKNKLVVEI